MKRQEFKTMILTAILTLAVFAEVYFMCLILK